MSAGVQIKPRLLFCVVERAHSSRTVAEEVCTGKFTENGTTLELGLDPNWLSGGLEGDEEWQIAWSKFYFGLNLATAFAETGEYKFQRTWERLVDSWLRQVPTDFGPSSDAIGRRIQNWVYAWNIFASSPRFNGFCDGLEERIAASLAQQAGYLRNHLSAERNHRTLELHGLFVVALALPEIAEDNNLLKFAMDGIYENLLTDIRADGVHREHSTHYHMLVLRTFLAARENARRFGLGFPKDYDDRLERACEFAMHCRRPDGGIPELSDSDEGNYSDLLQLAASLLDRPDFLYAGTAGAQGVPPQKRYSNFPEAGYFVQRSGWGEAETPFEQERFLIFDCGPLGDGGHGHYDLLNIEVAAGGKPLIQDPGRYTYSEQEPNLRRWFKSTAAHNTVCVDGLDQAHYRRGKPKSPLPQSQLIGRWSAPGFDVICGKAESPCYDVLHTRIIFFINNEYWIIYDSLQGHRPHRFDLRFHLSPEAWNKTDVTRGDVALAPGLALVFSPGSKLQLEPGWIAPQYGVKLPAPVVSAVKEGALDAEFITLLMPNNNSQYAPEMRIFRGMSCPGSLAIEVRRTGVNGDSTDHIGWNSSIISHNLWPFRCRASAVWVREKEAGDLALQACNAETLRIAEAQTPTFTRPLPVPWIRWNKKDGLTEGIQRFE